MQNRIAFGLYPAPQTVKEKSESNRDWLRILFFTLIFILPLWPDFAELKPGGIPNIAPPRLIRAAMILFALICLFSDRERSALFFNRLRSNWVPLILLFCFFALRFASVFVARIPVLEFLVFIKNDFWSYLSIFLIALLVIKDEKDVKKIIVLVMLSGIVVGLVSVAEYFLKRNIFQKLINVNSDYMLAVLGDKTRDNAYRVQSTFEHPLLLGQFFAMTLPWCWYVLTGSYKTILRTAAILAGVLGVFAIYACGSRSSFAVAAPLLTLMMVWELWRWTLRSHNRPAQYLVLLQFPLILGLFGGALLYIKKIAAGTSLVTQGSADIRVEMLKAGLSKLTDALFLGHGFGDAAEVVTFIGRGGVKTLDNYYLVLALESGLVALLLTCALWSYFVLQAFSLSRQKNVQNARLAMLLCLAILAYSIIMSIHALPGLTWLLYVIFVCILVLKEKRTN